MPEQSSTVGDELDLRGLIRTLLRYKWWIVGVTLGAAAVVFLATQLGGGKSYQAKALIVFGQPPLNVNLEGSAPPSLTAFSLPDYKGITDLVTADDLLYEVYKAPELQASRTRGLTFGKLKQELNVQVSGTSQLLLQVTAADPEQAILVANLSAQAIANRINSLYGSSSVMVTALEQQTQDAQKAWNAAEKALVDQLSTSNVDALTGQLTQAQIAYNSQLSRVHNIDLVLSDGRALTARLNAQQPNAPLAGSDALGLLTLQQQASAALVCNEQPAMPQQPATTTTNSPITTTDPIPLLNCAPANTLNGLQVQLSGPNALSGQSTVADAQGQLKSFMDALGNQQSELKSGLAQAEKQLSDLRTQRESAQFQVNQLTDQRDLAESVYKAASSQLSSTRIEVIASGQVARVAGKAVQPRQISTSQALANAILAGITGMALVVLWVLATEWWRNSDTQPAK